MSNASSKSGPGQNRRPYLILAILLLAILLILFFRSFLPAQALFSNDGPLAVQVADPYKLPGAFFGIWNDLFWLGANNGSFMPNTWGVMLLGLGPYGYTNFHVPIALLFLGLCAAFFFRQLGFKPMVCILGGLAAALNGNFFSNGCWGLSSRALALAMSFLALAAIESSLKSRPIIKSILAGLAIGLSISDAGDNGAIFSLFVAAFAFFRTVVREGRLGPKVAKGIGKVALMAVCAGVLAAQTLNVFQQTAVKGIVGINQPEQSKEQKWGWATQWSLPKSEILRVIISGLYGYRVDAPDGGNYWGAVGQDASAPQLLKELDSSDPQARQQAAAALQRVTLRHSGAGEYAGVLVVLIALWGIAKSVRNSGNTYSELERKMIWFWSAMAFVAMLLGWGRYAQFYQFIYALPYFSTIRNPMKFFHPFHLALLILFAYGLQGLARRYLETAGAKVQSLSAQWKVWWAKAQPFEKRWTWGCIAAVALSILGFLIYSSSQGELAQHIMKIGFGDPDLSKAMAKFSVGEFGWFVLFLLLSVGAVLLVQSGVFAGRKAAWAGALLGLVLVLDLVRSDSHWIIYENYKEKYATNPAIEVLRQNPYEHRVKLLHGFFSEWVQFHFQFYNIQGLDVAQMPRVPEDYAAFTGAFGGETSQVRYWELCNVRYLLGFTNQLQMLNGQMDPVQHRFRIHTTFDIVPKPGVTSIRRMEDIQQFVAKPDGQLALFEFTGALPRVKLYSHWQISTNDHETLTNLASPAFDPAQSVLVAGDGVAPAPATAASNAAPATVTFASYSPRKIELNASNSSPAMLLLNDRFDPNWKVEVDGKPAPLLRCNFIMRGVHLPAGQHQVTFRFAPDHTMFFVSLGAVVVGLLLVGFLLLSREPGQAQVSDPQTAGQSGSASRSTLVEASRKVEKR